MTDNAQLSDIALVEQAQRELPYRSTAYELLMKRHQSYLYRLIFASLKDSDESQDVLQDVLVRVYKGLPAFERKSAFRTWLTTIAINRCNTRHEKIKRDKQIKELLQGQIQIEPEYEPAQEPDSEEFGALIRGLNYQERQILSLRFIGELDLKEIADIVGLALSATKMKYYRSLEKIKQQREGPPCKHSVHDH